MGSGQKTFIATRWAADIIDDVFVRPWNVAVVRPSEARTFGLPICNQIEARARKLRMESLQSEVAK